jgi:pimeloyl-ACP methyl ester carboxylesterase
VGARRRRNEWASIDEAYDAYASKPPLDVMTAESLRSYVEYGLRDRGDGAFVLKCRPEVEAAVYTMGAVNGMFERLPAIDTTVRVVCGAQTDAIVPRLAERIASLLPHGSVEIWDGHGHFGPQADPDRAATSMLAFATA